MSAARRMLGAAPRAVRAVCAPLALASLLLVVLSVRPVAAQTEVVEYYGQDALGSIRIVFNASGAAIARADYEPFGELFAVPNMPGTSGLPAKQFTGQERDAEASLDYFGARFFVPRTGRFSQVDPVYAGLFDPQQWNRYQYARNNPLTFVDPTGLDDETPPEDPNAPGGYSCAAILALNAHDPYCWRPSPWDWADPSTYLPGAWHWIGSTLESVMPEITPGDTVIGQIFGVQLVGAAVVAAGVVAAPGVVTATTSAVLTKAPAATTVVVAAGGGAAGVGATAEGAALSRGVSVLGHYPGYVNLAQSMGARYFSVPSNVWAGMSAAEQWAANTRFLERLVLRGDVVVLATPAMNARPGSAYAMELEYLFSRGYSLNGTGTRMLPPGR